MNSDLDTANTEITVVNVVAFAYSGGTWLNLLLGSHPQAFSIGEMRDIVSRDKALCTIHGEDCPVFSRFDHRSEENPFLQLHRITGKRFLIANKSRKFLKDQDHPGIQSRFIHLVRDGRAVSASYMRKHPEITTLKACRIWAHHIRRDQRMIRRQRKPWLTVIYEKLLADPEGRVKEICDFVGMSYDQAMLQYWTKDHHYVGGNHGTLFAMTQKRDGSIPEMVVDPTQSQTDTCTWDLDFYKKTDLANFRDQRWKKQLTNKQLLVFALVGGRLNRGFGYSQALDRS